MKPHFFDDGQKEAVEAALERLGVGDDKSRRIFKIALDYELTEYQKRCQHEAGKEPVVESDESLDKISAAAGALSEMLRQLPGESLDKLSEKLSAADAYARKYNGRYLDALQDEIGRVSDACKGVVEVASGGGRESLDRHLVAMIANAYSECFEQAPLAAGGVPFLDLLKSIMAISHLDISGDKKVLKRWLKSGTS